MGEDYYKILGVGKNASQDEIKSAFRALALKYHPDRNKEKGAEEHFKSINAAYAVLSDPEKRKQYDAYGPDAFSQRYSQEDIFRNFDFESVFRNMGFDIGGDDIFSSMFGFGQQGRRADIGNDILASVRITIEEAARGATKRLRISHIKACDRCGGRGGEPGTKEIQCSRCGGSGHVQQTARTPFGMIRTVGACDRCGGRGRYFERACRKCNGSGAMRVNDEVEVAIPKGVDTGSRLRLQGMGDFGKDRVGDLYIDIEVQESRLFRREGDMLYNELHIPLHIALLGGEAMVQTIGGGRKVRIEPGVQNNSKIVLRGEGMPHMRGSSKGDHVATVIVDIPKHLSDEQRRLVKKLADLNADDEDKVRKFGIF